MGQYRIGTNIMEGRCVIINQCGVLYEGYFKNYRMQPYGRIMYRDGQSYQGKFKGERLHGFGVLRYKEQREFYYHRGFFKSGAGHGLA